MKNQLFVIDTNILIAGLITRKTSSPTVHIVDAMLNGELIYLISPELLNEYKEVLSRPKLIELHGLSDEEVDNLLIELTANGLWREPKDKNESIAPDLGDQHLWELLSNEPHSTLVTGDKLLLEHQHPKAKIISASAFLALVTP